ncbi:MAG: short-chain dehydrogenase [Armatimonadetes bacterium 55-13]|nr:bifunctional rhamnulose-1-phosphate aldolase/short-chain dehydrogenase [Armatimonadota bacterium]ODU53279.1 MAG: short-chain dehydrogenase [bacterium SCN 57-13]OJU61756.1 MAG: short-chain dehydrogenase [Armatimonadetes bacterium 55-13]
MITNPETAIPSLWDAAKAPSDPVDKLIYASNLLGSDPRITNFGGGNTSYKVMQTDPLTGEQVEVLWVKGSGGDLGTAKKQGFASLYQSKVIGLEERFKKESMNEDDIVPLYPHCVYNNNPAAPSIDTPLHSYVPFAAVSHMHSDAVISIAACADAEKLMNEIYQGEMGYLPWKRPGFELGLMLRDLIAANPGINSALMGQHGFICWADTWEECYELTLRLINKAAEYIEKNTKTHPFGEVVREKQVEGSTEKLIELLPMLRGKVTFNGQRLIAKIDQSEPVLEYLSRAKAHDLAKLGTSCPDHFLRTKIRPLILEDLSEAGVDAALAQFREDYAAYYERCKHADSPAMRNPNPSVVLIPGVGMISFGKNPTEARVTGEFYRNAIEVMRGAEAVSKYIALPEQEAFNIEYWLLEEAKLKRMPPEKELSRRIALLIGAGPGIGQEIAKRLLDQGASVVVADLNDSLVSNATETLRAAYGKELVHGSPINIIDRQSVQKAVEEAVKTFGGLDILINIAAVFIPPSPEGKNTDEQWVKSLEINVLGSNIVAEEAQKVMAKQKTLSSIVLTSSANAVVAKKGSLAYDTSKAAVNHLVRELAIECAPTTRVNAVAPATVVAGSQMFPRDRVIASLTKYDIPFAESDTDDELRDKLSQFYAKRTLLKQAVTPAKVADAAYLLASDRLGQTTGQVIGVDAGLADAFLR